MKLLITAGPTREPIDAVRFITEKAEKPADYGLDKPAYVVIVELKPDKDKPTETVELHVGKEMGDDGFAAKLKDDDLVFTVSSTLVDRLGREFRKRLVWDFKRSDVSSLVWRAGSKKVSIRLEDGAWKLIEPAGGRIDAIRLDELLGVVSNIRVERFTAYTKDQLAKYGLDKPRMTVKLTIEDTDRTLTLGKEKDKDYSYVMVSDNDVVFTLPTSSAKTLLASPMAPPEKPEEKTGK